jgi:hypothetical protein
VRCPEKTFFGSSRTGPPLNVDGELPARGDGHIPKRGKAVYPHEPRAEGQIEAEFAHLTARKIQVTECLRRTCSDHARGSGTVSFLADNFVINSDGAHTRMPSSSVQVRDVTVIRVLRSVHARRDTTWVDGISGLEAKTTKGRLQPCVFKSGPHEGSSCSRSRLEEARACGS